MDQNRTESIRDDFDSKTKTVSLASYHCLLFIFFYVHPTKINIIYYLLF